MAGKPSRYNTVIVGGGPAGTGILMKAIKDGSFRDLLDNRICLIEKTDQLLVGNLPSFNVNSDTLSNVFLECLEGRTLELIEIEQINKEISMFKEYNNRSIPLPLTRSLLEKIGQELFELIKNSDSSTTLLNTEINTVNIQSDRSYLIKTDDGRKIISKNIIIACGGNAKEISADPKEPLNTFHSDVILKGEKDLLLSNLEPEAKIVIIGGSHSAFSVAHYLLDHINLDINENNPIQIWSKRAPKIYFESASRALNSGYTDFTDEDICPLTKRVYRLSGLRMDGRQLYMRMLGLNECKVENRVQFNYINDFSELQEVIGTADLVIEATGYQFSIPKFVDENKEEIDFAGKDSFHWVDEKCRLVKKNGEILKNAFALGLASGFIPSGELGGEESFKGQTNGLWYYQNLVAEVILNQL